MKRIFSILLKILNSFLKQFNKHYKILVICNSITTISHINRWIECVDNLEDTDIYLLVRCNGYSKIQNKRVQDRFSKNTNIKLLKSSIYLIGWNLFVIADYTSLYGYNKDIVPILFINHGFNIISYNDGIDCYTYRHQIATMYLEADYIVYLRMKENPSWSNHIRYVGSKICERLDKINIERNTIREKIGITANDKLIVCFSSWNVDSLFQNLSDNLIEVVMKMANEGYKFVLSAHPNEYLDELTYKKLTKSEKIPIGKKIDSLANKNIIIRKPNEDFLSYIVAADLIISDFSTMAYYAIIAKKNLILSIPNLNRIWKKSTMYSLCSNFINIQKDDNIYMSIKKELKIDKSEFLNYQSQFFRLRCESYDELVKEITRELLKGEKNESIK